MGSDVIFRFSMGLLLLFGYQYHTENRMYFSYCYLYYIESPEGNAYFFQDKNDDRELGYTIAEDIS